MRPVRRRSDNFVLDFGGCDADLADYADVPGSPSRPNLGGCWKEPTARKALADGLAKTSSQKRKVRQLLDSFNLAPLGDKSILRMSYGEFRAVLTMRALVNDPEILILDEPFDGLDAPA